jgi:hypothetical protein
MSMGRVISVFSCSGKTHFVVNQFDKIDCIDHDFYDYRFRGKLPDWELTYMNRMAQLRAKFDFVFVNAIPEVLKYPKMLYMVIYPHRSLKSDWVNRAIRRGGESEFPKLLDKEWDNWIDLCEQFQGKKIVLAKGEYLSDFSESFRRMTGITVA